MDEAAVKEHAQRHSQAVVAGDLRTAGSDLTPEGQANAGPVMKALPSPLTGAEVTAITSEDDEYLAYITYQGTDSETIVVSRWVERDGRPMIVELTLS